jgi:hypothetical protein
VIAQEEAIEKCTCDHVGGGFMSIRYYIGFHGVSLTMSFNIEIYDLSRFLAQHHYLNLVLTQKLK